MNFSTNDISIDAELEEQIGLKIFKNGKTRLALQHALEQLAGLKQNGKLIGIISHAHGIEDIVPVVLHFENHAGYSTISGPGVSGDTRKVQIPEK